MLKNKGEGCYFQPSPCHFSDPLGVSVVEKTIYFIDRY